MISVAAASLLVAACGGGGHSTHQSRTTASTSDAVKFSQCMRRHGLPNFPDVVPDEGLPILHEANGSVAILVNGVPQPVSGPAFRKALSDCTRYSRSFMANAVTGGTANRVQSALVETAACMRKHGVPNYPDPPALGTMTFGEHMSATGRALSAGINVAAPAFRAALAKCGSIMSNALNG